MPAKLVLPTMNVEPLQRGLDSIFGALEQQRQIQNQRQTADATLRVRQALDDKMNELTNSQDLSGDWGTKFRDYAAQFAASEAAGFSDPRAATDFANGVATAAENQVNGFRQIQVQKQKEVNSAAFLSGDQAALDKAATDLVGAVNDLHTRWGATGGTDPATGHPTITFSAAALQAYGGPEKTLQAYKDRQDALAATNLDGMLRNLQTDTSKTEQQRADAIKLL